MRTVFTLVLAATLAGSAALAAAPASHPDHAVLAQFHCAVREYVGLHRMLEIPLPTQTLTSDPEEIRRATDALATAIRAARAGAKQGDVFTKQGGLMIRARVHAALDRHAYDATVLLHAMQADTEGPPPPLAVNRPFPWHAGNAMWPLMLQELPALPEELEFRFVGRDLVLLDVHANLIVDILPAVLPVW
jgi:hypothetical protein